MVDVGKENGVWCAFEAGPDVCSEVLVIVSMFVPLDTKELLTLTGQMKYGYRINTLVIPTPKMTVNTQAPTKPSTVFLGESLMSCVLPTVIPTRYAKISLQMTRETGKKNQIIPSNTLFIIKCACTTMRYKAM
jgi:hypothetical protein